MTDAETIKNVPIMVWLTPDLEGHECVTRVAGFIVSLDETLRDHILYLLSLQGSYAHTMCGSIFAGDLIYNRAIELLGED